MPQTKKVLLYRAILCRSKVTNFLKNDENFARRIVWPDENFGRQSFARTDNPNLSKSLFSLLRSFVPQLRTLLLLLGETFCRAKVTNVSFSDENLDRRILSDKVSRIPRNPIRGPSKYNLQCLMNKGSK